MYLYRQRCSGICHPPPVYPKEKRVDKETKGSKKKAKSGRVKIPIYKRPEGIKRSTVLYDTYIYCI
jgi:hypothetical protein